MPNWTSNVLICERNQINYMMDEGKFDLEKIQPMPKAIRETPQSHDAIEGLLYGVVAGKYDSIKEQIAMSILSDYYNPLAQMFDEAKIEVSQNKELLNELNYARKTKEEFENSKNFKHSMDIADKYLFNTHEYGASNSYEWALKFWGTKWNADDSVKRNLVISGENGAKVIECWAFNTANNAPWEVLKLLARRIYSNPLLLSVEDEDADYENVYLKTKESYQWLLYEQMPITCDEETGDGNREERDERLKQIAEEIFK